MPQDIAAAAQADRTCHRTADMSKRRQQQKGICYATGMKRLENVTPQAGTMLLLLQ
jgi:hypothetical protein